MNLLLARRILLFVAIGVSLREVCHADVSLPSLFSDNMVLQQRDRITIWGKADPGENVTVQLGPNAEQAAAGKDGSWSVKLGGLKAGGPYDLVVSGKNSITVHNVAVGEVWVCSGESNMEFPVDAARNADAEMAAASLPMIRVFTVKHSASEKPRSDCEGAWAVCDPDTVKDFSAIGYFFARELNRGMRIPVGIIQSAWGPSPAEAWTPGATLEKDTALHPILDRYDKAAAAYPAALAAYQSRLAEWASTPSTSSTDSTPSPSPRPHKPIAPLPPGGQREPAALYNGMIAPLLRYSIRGVLWYQGESNTSDPLLYRKLFPAMIASWRSAWEEPDFPFFYVQLPGFLIRHPLPTDSRWAALREAQSMALSAPKTGMVVTIDLGGGEHDIHPADKQDVAHRLFLIAQTQVYGKSDVVASGPVFSGMQIQDGKAVLSFAHLDGGIEAQAGPSLKGFAIAGEDRNFVWADAEIHDDKVIVQSKDVPQPVAVRYAWADNPDSSLSNLAGLPASPFRTDKWVPGELPSNSTPSPTASPAKTHGKKHHEPDE